MPECSPSVDIARGQRVELDRSGRLNTKKLAVAQNRPGNETVAVECACVASHVAWRAPLPVLT